MLSYLHWLLVPKLNPLETVYFGVCALALGASWFFPAPTPWGYFLPAIATTTSLSLLLSAWLYRHQSEIGKLQTLHEAAPKRSLARVGYGLGYAMNGLIVGFVIFSAVQLPLR